MCGVDRHRHPQAAANVVQLLGAPPARSALIVCGRSKEAIGAAVADAARDAGLAVQRVTLDGDPTHEAPELADLVRSRAGRWALVLLLDPPQAPWLFEIVGRPDRGVRLPQEHLFCDWLLSSGGLLRTYAVDLEEAQAFRQRLLAVLTGAETLHVTTPAGTDLRLTPRHWIAHWGEVFTAPVEGSARGVLCVDGAAYSGVVPSPWRLEIESGRIANLCALAEGDAVQRLAYGDLARDVTARSVAEVGIGVNAGARWDADVMEAEQARGTCHVGFGRNLDYGGAQDSAIHVDLCLLRPTIRADGNTVCRDGAYRL